MNHIQVLSRPYGAWDQGDPKPSPNPLLRLLPAMLSAPSAAPEACHEQQVLGQSPPLPTFMTWLDCSARL